jgi:hypothetical protein
MFQVFYARWTCVIPIFSFAHRNQTLFKKDVSVGWDIYRNIYICKTKKEREKRTKYDPIFAITIPGIIHLKSNPF